MRDSISVRPVSAGKRSARVLTAGALCLALLGSAQAAQASDLPSGGLTRQDVASWLGRRGLTANIHNDSKGETIVSSAVGGVNFDIYFYACSGDRCGSIQYAAGWTPLAKGTSDNINGWNRDKRYIRAYLDRSNNVWGEYDIDIKPGGTWEQMDQTMDRWTSQVADFKVWIGG